MFSISDIHNIQCVIASIRNRNVDPHSPPTLGHYALSHSMSSVKQVTESDEIKTETNRCKPWFFLFSISFFFFKSSVDI